MSQPFDVREVLKVGSWFARNLNNRKLSARQPRNHDTRIEGCMGEGDVSREFNMLDACSMVLGAAIAGVHVRQTHPESHGLPGWILLAAMFSLVAVTASGPFLYVSKRFLGRPSGKYPLIGDRLWVLWGAPWVISALIESAWTPSQLSAGRPDPVYVGTLGLGLFLTTMVAVPILAARYFWGDPEATRWGTRVPWSQRVGLALSATWPIQCGVGLVLMG